MNQALAWLVAGLFVILPLAHVPALRNLLSLAAGILITAMLMRERRMPPLPAFPMAAWIALGTASALWSADPATTLHGVLYDMLLPAGVFLAAWRAAADERAFDRVRWAAAGGVLCLGIMVALVFATGRPAAMLLSDVCESSVTYYWPGIGVSSTFAALIVPFSLFALTSVQSLLLAAHASFLLIAAAAVIAGFSFSLGSIIFETGVQRAIAPEKLSRVSAYSWMCAMVFLPLGYALAGPIAAAVGMSAYLVFGAVWIVVTTAVVFAVPAVRNYRLPAAAMAAS